MDEDKNQIHERQTSQNSATTKRMKKKNKINLKSGFLEKFMTPVINTDSMERSIDKKNLFHFPHCLLWHIAVYYTHQRTLNFLVQQQRQQDSFKSVYGTHCFSFVVFKYFSEIGYCLGISFCPWTEFVCRVSFVRAQIKL